MASSEEIQQKKLGILFGLIGTGGRDFERASSDYYKDKYDGKAINAASLEPVIFTGWNDTRYTYLKDRNGRFPPVRFETPLREYLPFDGKLRIGVEDWFYGSLEAGQKLDAPDFNIAGERSSDAFLTMLMQKYCPVQTPVPTEEKKAKQKAEKKAKRRNQFLESDEEEEEPVVKKKAKKKAKKRNQFLESDEEA